MRMKAHSLAVRLMRPAMSQFRSVSLTIHSGIGPNESPNASVGPTTATRDVLNAYEQRTDSPAEDSMDVLVLQQYGHQPLNAGGCTLITVLNSTLTSSNGGQVFSESADMCTLTYLRASDRELTCKHART